MVGWNKKIPVFVSSSSVSRIFQSHREPKVEGREGKIGHAWHCRDKALVAPASDGGIWMVVRDGWRADGCMSWVLVSGGRWSPNSLKSPSHWQWSAHRHGSPWSTWWQASEAFRGQRQKKRGFKSDLVGPNKVQDIVAVSGGRLFDRKPSGLFLNRLKFDRSLNRSFHYSKYNRRQMQTGGDVQIPSSSSLPFCSCPSGPSCSHGGAGH